MRPEDLSSTSCSAERPSVNFHKLSVRPEDLLSNFRVAEKPTGTFVNFPFFQETFRHLLSTFSVARTAFVNLF